MSKIEITPPFDGYEGMKDLTFRFKKTEDKFGYNADVQVWVNQTDSVSAMRAEAARKARIFISEMLASLDAEFPHVL